jgi:hypothetical protein
MKSEPSAEERQPSRPSIIARVTTPLGLLVLTVLVVEGVLGILALRAEPPDTTYLIAAMVLVLILVIILVVALAIWRPEALAGLRPGGVAATSDKAKSSPTATVEKIAETASVEADQIDPKLVRFIPPLRPTQYRILGLPRPLGQKFYNYQFAPVGKVPIYGIPFHLIPVADADAAMRGHLVIDLQPTKTNEARNAQVEAEVRNAKVVHFLISAGHGWRMHEGVQFLNRRIGYLRFVFEVGPSQRFDLVLGKHLREWAFGNNTNLVTEIDLEFTRPAWLSHDSTKRIDILTVPLDSPPRNLILIEAVAEFEDDHAGLLIDTPAIIISAITVERAT